jgi:6-phosphogluconate dehydrogenase
MAKSVFGVIGLGVMGKNLALNMEEHGFSVAVWNREPEWTDAFVAENKGKKLVGAKTLEELRDALEKPRRILIMIKAGAPVDMMLESLSKVLERGDIIIDGGNSWYKDTEARQATMQKFGIHFMGAGVSGGEEGARHGPCLMPGGPPEAYAPAKEVFEAIAAKTDSGSCVTHVGPDGAGHFVKMVHNGIEYGDMQLIAEAYDLLRRAGGMGAAELAEQFATWNRGRLESFLIELTAKVFKKIDDETGKPLVDVVLDAAGQKGTGKWTAQVALDLAVPIPTIAAAIDARVLSSMKKERVAASKQIAGPPVKTVDKASLVEAVENALYASKVCSYAQGMNLIRTQSDANKWNVKLGEMARIWKGGCIIRARFLDEIRAAYERNANLANLLLDDAFRANVQAAQPGWRRAISLAAELGIPTPAMSASLTYFDSYRTADLPQNLTQAQRDAFGAHTYERSDHPERGAIHTNWL